MKAIKDKPEYVCTCCHRWLFKKSVTLFSEKDYDFANSVVAKALSDKYRYKMRKLNNASTPVNTEHKVSHSTLGNAEHEGGTYEYICVTCKRCLTRKRPKIPAQAVANYLELSDIPPELADLNDLERRLISLQIPFLKILSLFKYGSHYKVDGPPVNVPATIDKICKLLPRLPDDAQVFPMKLKRKLKYKGSYMYNTIRKDVVMNALRWLKNNNEFYKDIDINEFWADHWNCDDLGVVLETKAMNDDSDTSSALDSNCEESNIPHHDETPSQYLERLQDEKELIEDQLAADRMAEINGEQDACSLQLENIEDGVYSVAPGEDNMPKYVLLDKNFEVLAFPDLFPFGKNGFDSVLKRETDFSLRRYYQQRIFNVDGHFAKNIEYLFCAQYASDFKQVQSEANIAL